MEQGYLGELLEIAVHIMELDQHEEHWADRQEWKAAKQEYDTLKVKFNEVRDNYVDALLDRETPQELVVDDVQSQLMEFRASADPSWTPAIDFTENNLLPHLIKEAGKSPTHRKVIKSLPYVAAVCALIGYFGIRLFSVTPVTEELESRNGLIQRAAATEKVIRYDDWMGTRVRKGGWLKGIVLWPIEPTEQDIAGAAEFVGLVFDGQEYAQGCGQVVGYGDQLTDAQIVMVGDVADYIQRDDTNWSEEPILTVLQGLEQSSGC